MFFIFTSFLSEMKKWSLWKMYELKMCGVSEKNCFFLREFQQNKEFMGYLKKWLLN